MNHFSVPEITRDWALKAGLALEYFTETTSTNDQAKAEAAGLSQDIKFYLAEKQTQGRGRGTNTWSTGENNLLLSISYSLNAPPQPQLSPLLGLALYRASLASFPQLAFSLKAPNDLFLQNKKCAGLLTEVVTLKSLTDSQSSTKYRLVIGLGYNIFHSPISTSSHISEFWPELSAMDWMEFMDRLLLEFTMCVASRPASLSPLQRQIITKAINLNANSLEPLLDISSAGDLLYQSGTTPWSHL